MNNWIPAYRESPVFVPHLQAIVSYGTYIQYHNNVERSNIGRLLSPGEGEDQGRILVVAYKCVTQQAPLPIDNSLHSLQEIQWRPVTESISIEQITEIAFVFNETEFRRHAITVSSVFTNFFLLRTSTNTRGQNNHTAFPCDVYVEVENDNYFATDSLSKSITNDIRNLRTAIHVCLNKYTLKQGEHFRGNKIIAISMHGWNYLLRNLDTAPRRFESKRCLARMGMHGKRIKIRHESSCFLLRSETQEELSQLNELLGGGILLGFRGRAPPLHQRGIHLINGDIVNIIDGGLYDGPLSRRVPLERTGIDFIYKGDHTMIVELRYKRCQYEDTNIEQERLISAPHPDPDPPTQQQQQQHLNKVFFFNNVAYTVIRQSTIDGTDNVIGVDKNTNEVQLQVELVTFINMY